MKVNWNRTHTEAAVTTAFLVMGAVRHKRSKKDYEHLAKMAAGALAGHRVGATFGSLIGGPAGTMIGMTIGCVVGCYLGGSHDSPKTKQSPKKASVPREQVGLTEQKK